MEADFSDVELGSTKETTKQSSAKKQWTGNDLLGGSDRHMIDVDLSRIKKTRWQPAQSRRPRLDKFFVTNQWIEITPKEMLWLYHKHDNYAALGNETVSIPLDRFKKYVEGGFQVEDYEAYQKEIDSWEKVHQVDFSKAIQ